MTAAQQDALAASLMQDLSRGSVAAAHPLVGSMRQQQRGPSEIDRLMADLVRLAVVHGVTMVSLTLTMSSC